MLASINQVSKPGQTNKPTQRHCRLIIRDLWHLYLTDKALGKVWQRININHFILGPQALVQSVSTPLDKIAVFLFPNFQHVLSLSLIADDNYPNLLREGEQLEVDSHKRSFLLHHVCSSDSGRSALLLAWESSLHRDR